MRKTSISTSAAAQARLGQDVAKRVTSADGPAPWRTDASAESQPDNSSSSPPRSPRTQDVQTLVDRVKEGEKVDRLAELNEARQRVAAERAAAEANVKPRLYSWRAEAVAEALQDLGFPACADCARQSNLAGYRFIHVEESAVQAVLEPINSKTPEDLKAAKAILAHFRAIRDQELNNAPKLSAVITTKIDGSKRSCNLNLNETKISTFPDVICDIPSLTNISALHNRLKVIPDEIGCLTRLVNLKLGQNKLVALPESLGRCRALQMIMAEDNELKSLPRSLGNCPALRVVDVSKNQLRMLPSTLSKCSKMVKLITFDNPLKLPREVIDEGTKAVLSLLDSIGDAEEGGYLRVVKSKMKTIPTFIFDMKSLTMLNLDCNRIKHLDGLHVLTGLQSLSFVENIVEHIPISLAGLTNLTELKYQGNPITSPPQHVLVLGALILVRYLAARTALLSENLREAFKVFDDDGSGSVNRQELIDGLEKVDLHVDRDDVIALIEEYDDGNGLIDYEEFKGIMLELIKKRSGDVATSKEFSTDTPGLQNELRHHVTGDLENSIEAQSQNADEVLNLSSLEMTEYTVDLDEPGQVTVLNLAHNYLTDMPDVKRLKSVRSLILDGNSFTDVPKSIFELGTLRKLSMKRCRLTWLPEVLFAYKGLEELYLEGNQMLSLPCDLVRMTSLRALALHGNPFRDPLMSITQEGMEYTMAYLKFFYTAREFGLLDLKEMDFGEMPYESDVRMVKEIKLNKNRFQVAPELLLQAQMLTALDFSENYLEKIPSNIWEALTNLVHLRISNNRLNHLSRSFGELHKLETFHCDENLLEELPNTMSSLQSLKHMDLTHNRLLTIEVSVGKLPKIQTLILSRNRLTTLPPEIKGLQTMKSLTVRSNDIETIPDVWDHLNLTHLDLGRNPLKEIPLSIGALVTSMQEISIDRHLHLDDPPDNMVARGTKPFLSYMQKLYLARKSKDLVLGTFHLAKITVPLQQLDNACGGLRLLDVSNNNIENLPRNIGMVRHLEALIVRDNRLASFPTSCKELKTLTHLDAAGNSFDLVPEMLTYTPLIKILDLSRNKLTSLYRKIDDVTNAGFNDAISAGKRARAKRNVEQFEGRRLRQIIEIKVMDRVAAKVRSDNRSKQVGALFQLYNLEKLSLASNHISLLPGTVARFTMLKELNVAQNELNDLPPDMGSLTRLRRVDFSHNNLMGIPPEVGNLGRCRYLDVSYNRLRALPNTIGNMTSLTDLNFEHNELVFVPVTLQSLETCLTKLNADHNRILDPPAEILGQGRDAVFTYFRRVHNGQKSRSLVLIDMKLEVLDLNWENLTVLTDLELSGNRIKHLPAVFTILTNLVVLKAAGNSLERIIDAEDLHPLSSLTRLALKENHITEIEASIGHLVMLRDLDLSCNRLSKIAPQIERCTHIKRLILSQNQLHHIPRNVFRILLLETFDASNNSLRELPTAMTYCKSMLQLLISHNRIEQLPPDIGNLVNLQVLNVGTNILRALPPSIKHCERMVRLNLSNNKMSFLPPEIRKLKKLRYLNIKDNTIVSVPIEIKELSNLETLDIDGNPFLSAPSSVKELQSIKEIILNPAQTSALFFGGTDITPILNLKDLAEDRIVLQKPPRAHVLTGVEAMSGYLDRIDQRASLPSLNLTHMKLSFLPLEIFALTGLTVLDVKENVLEFLPETIGLLSHLTNLDASVNKLKQIPETIGELTGLTTLCMGRNELEFLPASLMKLYHLSFIDVHVNHLPTLLPEDEFHEYQKIIEEREEQAVSVDTPTTPATPAQMPSSSGTPKTPTTPGGRRLRRGLSVQPSLDHNAFSKLLAPPQILMPRGGIVLLSGLRDLECSYNELEELPDMSRMVNLTRINVAHNHLRSLPDVICELEKLEKIECGDNRVRSVPTHVSRLTSLTLLSLKNNNLRHLPKQLGRCVSLKSLSLNGNDLMGIPEEICQLENLKRLSIAANNCQTLPWRMGDMASLQTLDLASNPVLRLPPSLGMLSDVLQKIDLFECQYLIEPPEPILQAGHARMMEYLRKLWRGFTTMRMVLTSLGMGSVEFDFSQPELQGLVELRLDKNDLKNLPEPISELPVLLSLRFRDNQVVNLHDCFSKLTSLQELDISKNRFIAIPAAVLALTQLQRLRVTNNPIPYTMPNDWIENGPKMTVGDWLGSYVRETIGRRISAMWSNNNLAEVLDAWRDVVDEIKIERAMAAGHDA